MSKYIFIKEKNKDNKFDNTNVIIEVETESLNDLVDAFEEYLLACGFKFPGSTLDLVEVQDE